MIQRPLKEEDFIDLTEWFKHSSEWIGEEGLLKGEIDPQKLKVWMSLYDRYEGEWLIWTEREDPIGISFHVGEALSNGRAWIGMVLVAPNLRRKGYGRKILSCLSEYQRQLGEKIIYTACPFNRVKWLNFLAESGFEQIGMDTQENGKQYIKLAKPL